VSNLVIRSELNRAFDHYMRLHDAALADFHFRSDQSVGADLDIFAEAGAGIDDCSGMNRHSTPISLKLK
jgi:hypothetical protein